MSFAAGVRMLELFGYAASVITAMSLMMSNIWKLRWLNMAGSGMLMIYSVFVRAWPVAAVNAFIVGVDIYYLRQLYCKRDMFSLMEVPAEDGTFLKTFLEMYGADIEKFFPGFALAHAGSPRCIFILRNLAPVGLFVCEDEGNGAARILLDYAIPPYRDLSSARFFYNSGYSSFLKAGYRELVMRSPSPAHAAYLRRVGFSPSSADASAWVKTLAAGRDAPSC